MLQETHSLTEDKSTWRDEIGSLKVFYSHGTNDSKGTLIALGSSLDYTLQSDRNHIICDPGGRFIILNIEIQGCLLLSSIFWLQMTRLDKLKF